MKCWGRMGDASSLFQQGEFKVHCSHEFRIFVHYRAWTSLNSDQKKSLEESADIVQCRVDTIERVGGGGIRCMLAGIFATRKK